MVVKVRVGPESYHVSVRSDGGGGGLEQFFNGDLTLCEIEPDGRQTTTEVWNGKGMVLWGRDTRGVPVSEQRLWEVNDLAQRVMGLVGEDVRRAEAVQQPPSATVDEDIRR